MQTHKIDILCLTDTGTTQTDLNISITNAQLKYPGYYFASTPINTPTPKPFTTKRPYTNKLGGVLIIANNTWARSLTGYTTDKTQLGILSKITLHLHGLSPITIIPTYLPINHSSEHDPAGTHHPHSLWHRIQQHIDTTDRNENPEQYITNTIGTWIGKAKQKNHNIIILGDMNQHWTEHNQTPNNLTSLPSIYNITHWATSQDLTHPAYQQRKAHNQNLPHTFNRPSNKTHSKDQLSTPDHILTDHTIEDKTIDTGTCTCPGGTLLSDHRPTWITLNIPQPSKRSHHKIPSYIPSDLPLDDPKKKQEYEEDWETSFPKITLENLIDNPNKTMTDLSEHLLEILTHSYNLTLTIKPLRSKKAQGNWSPIMHILHEQHNLYQEIKTGIAGHRRKKKRHSQWTENNYKTKLHSLIDKWEFLIDKHSKNSQEERTKLRDITKLNPDQLRSLTLTELTPQLITEQLIATRKLFHKNQTKLLTAQIRQRAKQREDRAKANKIGQAIKSVLGKTQNRNEIRNLDTRNGHTTDPYEIHQKLTDHFENHFTLPDTAHPTARSIKDDPHLWKDLLSGKINTKDLPGMDKIPAHLTDLFDTAIRSTSHHPTLKDKMQEAFEKPFTEDQFLKILANKTPNKAGGISNCTINMMKAWPEYIKSHVFTIMNKFWENNYIPDWWKNRWILPIPKTPQARSPDQMRPIALYEITRKIWTSMVLSRIQPVLYDLKIMQHSQNGFTPEKAADTALLQLINCIEEAIQSNNDLYYTSWDMKAAFDSPSKNLLKLAWTRMGVPETIVNWLINIDIGGRTYIKTPLAIHIAHTTETKKISDTILQYFIGECGVGQGDTQGPITYNVAIDILHTMLSLGLAEDYYTRDDNQRLRKQPAIGFADDFSTLAATKTTHQLQADIICAFCTITGLRIAPHKMHTTSWGIQPMDTTPLILHDSQWQPISQEIYHYSNPEHQNKMCRTLGMYINTNHTTQAQENIFMEKLLKGYSALHFSKASSELKWTALNLSLTPELAYLAKLAPWNQTKLEQIDRRISQIIRKTAKLLPGTAQSLLYIPSQLGGLNTTQFSTYINKNKWNMYIRATRNNTLDRHAAKAIMGRTAEQTYIYSPPYATKIIDARHADNSNTWITSLVQWLAKSGKQLVQSGYTPNIWDTPINIPSLTPTKTIQWIADRDITTYGDYISPTNSHSTNQSESPPCLIHQYLAKSNLTSHTRTTLTNHLQDITNNHNLTLNHQIQQTEQIKLRRGQVWYSGDHKDSAFEILGRASEHSNPQYHWKEWKIYHRPKSGAAQNTKLWPQNHQSRGAGSTLIASWDELFPEYHPERLLYHMSKAGEMVIDRATTDEPSPDRAPRAQLPPKWIANLIIIIAQHFQLETYNIDQSNPQPNQLGKICDEIRSLNLMLFTDGSQKKSKPKLSQIFYPPTPQMEENRAPVNGAVVLLDPTLTRENQEILAIHLTDINHEGHSSAYDGEFLSINLAQYINQTLNTTWPIKTDCQSAVKLIKQTTQHIKPTASANNHHYTLFSTAPGPKPKYTIEHIPGHPEKRKPNRKDWNYLDYGNFIADLVAKGNTAKLDQQAPGPTIIHLKYPDIANDILPIGEWTIRPKSNIPTSFKATLSDHNNHKHKEYINTREAYRKIRKLPPKWSNSTFLLAGKIWKRLAHTISARAKATKHIYDWTWTGQNQAKENTGTQALPCKICNEPDTQYHLFSECNHPILTSLRQSIMTNLTNTSKEITDKTNPTLAKIAQTFTHLITNPPDLENWQPERLWKGLWTEQQVQYFLQESDLQHLHQRKAPTTIQINSYTQTLTTLTITLADGIRQLFSARTQIIYTNNKRITIQPSTLKKTKKPKKKSNQNNDTINPATETHIRDITPQLLTTEIEFPINRQNNHPSPSQPDQPLSQTSTLNYQPNTPPPTTGNIFDTLTTINPDHQGWEESKSSHEVTQIDPGTTLQTNTHQIYSPTAKTKRSYPRTTTTTSSKSKRHKTQHTTRSKNHIQSHTPSQTTRPNPHHNPPNITNQSNTAQRQISTPTTRQTSITELFQKSTHKRKISTSNSDHANTTTQQPDQQQPQTEEPIQKKPRTNTTINPHPATSKSSSLSKDDIT